MKNLSQSLDSFARLNLSYAFLYIRKYHKHFDWFSKHFILEIKAYVNLKKIKHKKAYEFGTIWKNQFVCY